MNVMAQAHKDTRNHIAQSCNEWNYRKLFAAKLRQCHKDAKMKAEELKATRLLTENTIKQFEERIVQLAALKVEHGHKYMVVVGESHPMPINFDSKQGWGNVETATKWNSLILASVRAEAVTNGNKEGGKAVLIADHIEWDMGQLQDLIDALKGK